jgi:hypothetical protein
VRRFRDIAQNSCDRSTLAAEDRLRAKVPKHSGKIPERENIFARLRRIVARSTICASIVSFRVESEFIAASSAGEVGEWI